MLTRRTFITRALGTLSIAAVAAPALALTTNQASNLVTQVAAEITSIMNAGGSRTSKYRSFEQVFARHADANTIARSVLGPTARSTSNADLSAFAQAFQGYVSRKYGKQLLDAGGGSVAVKSTRDRGRFMEVRADARIPGQSTFDVTFRVWDQTGSPKFIDMLVEGISLVTTERTEIQALLDQRGGSVSRLARDLGNMG